MSMLPKWRLLFEERCDTTEVFCFNQKIFIWNYYDPIFYSNNLTGIKHFHWARAGGNGFKLPCTRQSPSAMTTYLRHPNSYLLPRGSSSISSGKWVIPLPHPHNPLSIFVWDVCINQAIHYVQRKHSFIFMGMTWKLRLKLLMVEDH